jgi:secreted PhoX family phosphatase
MRIRDSQHFRAIVAERVSRRGFLLGSGAGLSAVAASGFVGSLFSGQAHAQPAQSSLTFTELTRIFDATHHVAEGYSADVVVAWGDPMKAGQGAFDPARLTGADLAERFGYNCDFIAFMPLPKGSGASDHGLLCVNNEYASPNVMFPGVTWDNMPDSLSDEAVRVLNATVGVSIVEIRLQDGKWSVVQDSPYNRRVTMDTPIAISGPLAGHPKMRTSYDPEGRMVKGTHYNCAGGVTPWGTILSCEEGAYDTFGGDVSAHPDAAVLERNGFDGSDYYGRARLDARFDLAKEPNEPNRFDWVVEIDPYDPAAMPVKRTALGRMNHECATVWLNRDGRVVVYMGDDDNFEYVYRFVSEGRFDPANPDSGRDLLDEGTLSVARFDADGTLHWLPLVHGHGPLTAENGFADQAEVLLKTRLAADALGATPMDSPEDVEANPVTGRVYALMTKNKKITADRLNPVNTRPENLYGHIVEMIPPGGPGAAGDHAADVFTWDLFVLCGNPRDPAHGAKFHPDTSENGWFVNPDNLTFDPRGRMFVATDGANDFGMADGIYGVDTEGPARGLPKLLFACPRGAEAAGPCFTPDGTTLFVAVQHPAEDSESLETVSTLWPDFQPGGLPRPAVVAIRRLDGGEVAA